MPAKIGNKNVGAIKVGSKEIAAAKKGTTTVYQKAVSGGGGGDGSLQDIVAETICDLEATKIDSYSGTGQAWHNLVTNPFGGDSQTDYDAQLGESSSASSDDPTFTGTAGSSGAGFALDGGDVFSIPNMTDYLRQLHWNDKQFTMIFCGNFVATGSHGLIGTDAASSSSSGLGFAFQSQTPRLLLQKFGGGSFFSTTVSTAGSATTGNICIVIAVDAVNGTAKAFLNGNKHTAAYSTTTVKNMSPLTQGIFGARYTSTGVPQFPWPNGSKFRSFALIKKYITDTEAAVILAEYNSRHGNIY